MKICCWLTDYHVILNNSVQFSQLFDFFPLVSYNQEATVLKLFILNLLDNMANKDFW